MHSVRIWHKSTTLWGSLEVFSLSVCLNGTIQRGGTKKQWENFDMIRANRWTNNDNVWRYTIRLLICVKRSAKKSATTVTDVTIKCVFSSRFVIVMSNVVFVCVNASFLSSSRSLFFVCYSTKRPMSIVVFSVTSKMWHCFYCNRSSAPRTIFSTFMHMLPSSPIDTFIYMGN